MNAAISAHESGRDPRPELNLPLSDTLEHISAAESELRMLQTELENLQAGEPRKKRNLEGLEREIAEREREREGLERFASEAVRAREGARREGKAERENTGQWWVSTRVRLVAGLTRGDAGTRARRRCWERCCSLMTTRNGRCQV